MFACAGKTNPPAERPPAGPAWVHEIKHNGYQLMVSRAGERVRLFTRRGFDWTERYSWIVHAARRLPVSPFLIEGRAGQGLVVLLSC